jgi:hypothetical protein
MKKFYIGVLCAGLVVAAIGIFVPKPPSDQAKQQVQPQVHMDVLAEDSGSPTKPGG